MKSQCTQFEYLAVIFVEANFVLSTSFGDVKMWCVVWCGVRDVYPIFNNVAIYDYVEIESMFLVWVSEHIFQALFQRNGIFFSPFFY